MAHTNFDCAPSAHENEILELSLSPHKFYKFYFYDKDWNFLPNQIKEQKIYTGKRFLADRSLKQEGNAFINA